jgi:uncharacterized delta-60 repeat protein
MKQFSLITLFWGIFILNANTQVVDPTFGIPSSISVPPFSEINVLGATSCDIDSRWDRSYATIHLEDGRIILAGDTQDENGTDFALITLLPNGKYDNSVGPQGQIRIQTGHPFDSCLVVTRYQTDQLLMGGCRRPTGTVQHQNLILKVDFKGDIDSSFGIDGRVVIDLPSDDEMITHILALPDGKILIGGNALFGTMPMYADSANTFVSRLLANGQIDSTFGLNGFIFKRWESACTAALLGDMVLDHLGNILITGGSYFPYPLVYDDSGNCSFNIFLCRYLPDGQPDTGFDSDGVIEFPESWGRGTALHAYDDGRILLVGLTREEISPFTDYAPRFAYMVRLNHSGIPDSTFGTNGFFKKKLVCDDNVIGGEPYSVLIKGDYIILGINVITYIEEGSIFTGAWCLKENGEVNTDFGNDGCFLFYPDEYLGYYRLNQITNIGTNHFFLSGSYRNFDAEDSEMLIIKVKFNGISTTQHPITSSQTLLYPNPGSDVTRLEYNTNEPMSIQLFDLQGRVVYRYELPSGTGVLDIPLASLPVGGYFLKAVTDTGTRVIKLIVAR